MQRLDAHGPPVSSTDQERFTQDIWLLSTLLREIGVRYSVVGGAALKAIFQEELPVYRANGTMVDLDGVLFGPDKQTVDETLSQIQKIRKDEPSFPEIGFEPAVFSDHPTSYSPLAVLSGMRVDSQGTTSLTYRKIDIPVPPETMETRTRSVNGVPIQVFPARTILHRYYARGGILKPKDEEKVARLEQHIKENSSDEPDEKYYEAYREFVAEIQRQYPLVIGAFRTFWNLDRSTNGKISGSKGALYRLIRLFTS